jgi:DNA-binding MarR family transcriptional regulator
MSNMNPLPSLPCLCSSIRRASRALTQRYERALRPLGLRVTQFTILQVLSRAKEASQGQLGEMLAMDSTTLTRTLEIMIQQRWVAERRGNDRRQRWLSLGKGGKSQLDRALPVWEKIQSQLQGEVGEHSWKQLFRLADQMTTLATSRRE